MSRGTQELLRVKMHFAYRTITVYGQPFHALPLYIFNPMSGSYNPGLLRFGLFRFRSPLLTESQLISIPAGTKMFQFPAFAFITYGFSNE